MHKNRMFYALIFINNDVVISINYMLSRGASPNFAVPNDTSTIFRILLNLKGIEI